MARTKISEYDSTSANNTDVDSINIAEGCAPSGINNAIREVMAHLKDFQTGASGDSLTVGGNLSVTGTVTIPDNAISGDKVEGGTINAITINTLTAGQANFGDNAKAIFGAGSDLQIYHDGQDSYIDDAGTGNLFIRGSAITRIQSYAGEDMVVAVTNGAVNLYNNNAIKLATTSTGIDVTGTVVSDGLQLDGGTANGVTYLNGSKVLTSGSALTFDGASLSVNSGTTNTAAIFTSTDAGAGIRLTDPTGSSSFETNGSLLRIGVDDDNVVASSEVAFRIDGSEKMRLTSTGLGIGTSSPTARLSFGTSTGGATDFSSVIRIYDIGGSNGNNYGFGLESATGRFSYTAGLGGFHAFYTANTERLRIDSSGNLLVGTTSVGGTGTYRGISLGGGAVGNIGGTYDYLGALYRYDSVNENGFGFWNTRGGASPVGGPILKFYVGSSFAVVGSITASSASTSYNTSSDYRLKEDWQPMTGASERVKALKPVNFAWKADGSRVDGFLAHEAQAVVPEAVHGEKDAVDAEGNPKYQGIDQSKLVPLLTAALQEALAKIESLEARLDAANL